MTINREISQFASFVSVDDATKNIGIAITSTPSIGIGTANPSAKFEVVGNTKLQSLNVTGIGTVATLSSPNGTITNLTGTSGTITTLNSTNGTITNLTGTAGTITTFNSTNGTITNLTGTSGTITTFNSTNGTITNGTITNLTGTAGTITTFNSTTGTITNLNSTTGTITNVTVSGLTSTGSLTVTGASVLFLQGLDVTGTASIDALTVFPGPSNLSGPTNLFGNLNVAGISTLASSGGITTTGGNLYVGSDLYVARNANITGGAYVSDNVGIGTTNPTSKLHVIGNANITGVITATTFSGAVSGTASSATQLLNPRTFQITGDVVASPVSFDGTGNVSLAATIQPNSVGLGTDTTGDYVRDITGTANQITVTGGTGESSTPTLSVPSQFTAPQDVTVTRDLLVNRNLNVNGNITIGGTSATLFTTELKIADPDIVLGFRTDGSGDDVSTDNTANHGGVALASTEGTPLVDLFIAGIETTPATYKKIMWFKSGTFAGLGTDAWLINYAVGIGSTQFPTGTRLAAGNIQFTQNDLAVVRNINSSGIVTATTFIGALTGTASSTTNIPNLTGAITSNNTTTSLGSFSSSDLATALTDETGSGSAVFATSPTLVTPVLGAATATSIVVSGIVTANSYNVGTAVGITTTITTGITTTAATTIDSFVAATFRSARLQIQITQSTNYQASDILVIHNETTASFVEYASIATNDYLGTLSVTVSGGNVLTQVGMVSTTSASVKVLSQKITV